ncbi:putative 15-hydroxyprostaglandin dehydrogenase [Nemania sp. FL0031]|nr:putative 15-hydroxyprostaglandin dehydrogenase [Nemania sp. FL0031]
MAELVITDDCLAGLKGKIVIVTGSSSGIGLATVQLLLSLGASVVGADVHPPVEGTESTPASPQFTFHKASVTEWSDLVAVFKKTTELHGRVDHVFANAGIGPSTNYVGALELDANGDPKEPSTAVLDVNLKGVINTTALAVHYMRQNPGGASGSSIVINASATGLQRFRGVDYGIAKHGAVGLMRCMHSSLALHAVPIRINALAPSWTASGMVNERAFNAAGVHTQTPATVARAAAKLMADGAHQGHLIHVDHGVYKEIDEALMLPTYRSLCYEGTVDEDTAAGMAMAAIAKARDQGKVSK